MSMQDTLNFFEALAQRLQHGGLLADQANDIAIRMTPHIDALKQAQSEGTNIIDVTPTQRTQSQVPVPYRPPAPPQDWNTPAQPQNWTRGGNEYPNQDFPGERQQGQFPPAPPRDAQEGQRAQSQREENPQSFRWGAYPANEGHQ